MAETAVAQQAERGIGYWMERVLAQRDQALKDFNADAVHDLRTALRRCRSIAEGFQSLDGHAAWKKMRKAGKRIFSALGELRDTQVLLEWIERLTNDCPSVAERLRTYCRQREGELKQTAASSLEDFHSQRWLQWGPQLEKRVQALCPNERNTGARRGPLPEPREVFELLALERYEAAHALHVQAMRSRSKAALHALRIGIKKFRYIVENFLPEHHEHWGKELKQLQDWLGEVHDLDVLAETARQVHALTTPQERQQFLAAVSRERKQRIQSYRAKMLGRSSLWQEWRAGLPAGDALEQAVLKRFEVWAATLDPDLHHTRRVTRFSLQLYDALVSAGLGLAHQDGAAPLRNLLQVAALTHDVGRARKTKAHHKASSRLLQKLETPPGWQKQDLTMAGLVARYHRGALPGAQKGYAALPEAERHKVDYLSGILRLADSLDALHTGAIRKIAVRTGNGFAEIVAEGYSARSKEASKIAAARCLLEEVCGRPVMIRGSSDSRPPHRARVYGNLHVYEAGS